MKWFYAAVLSAMFIACGQQTDESPVPPQITAPNEQPDTSASPQRGDDSIAPSGDSARPTIDPPPTRTAPEPDYPDADTGTDGAVSDTTTNHAPAPSQPVPPVDSSPTPPGQAPGTRAGTVTAPACTDANGMFLPASDTLFALVLFIRYEDEDIDNAWWPASGFPADWSNFIDETPDLRRTNRHNLTHFYREASRNAPVPFTLIGKVDTVTARIPLPNAMDYGESNRAVLQQIEHRYDASLAGRLDQWTRSEHCHTRTPNAQIDLIVMIWRTNRFRNSTINWSGIAHIGGSRTPAYSFLGKEVKLPAFNSNFSSGVTVATRERSVRDRLLNADVVFKSTIHEIAHQQITYNHPQGGSEGQQRFPSMLAYAEQEILSHNGREADLLGWGRSIPVSRDTTIVLGDFFETGESVWVQTSRYRYLIENRQQRSIYDDASLNPDDKGLFVYQFRSDRTLTLSYDGSNANIIPIVSDGFYEWEFSGRWLPGWQAIFNRGEANPSAGSGFTRKQPSTGTNHHWISAMVIDGVEQPFDFRGNGVRAAFNPDRPYLGADTNPSVEDIELRVLEQSGTRIRFSITVK